ncbi:MAG: thiamine biosynthesis protein ThiF [Colwellia sp.]|jgi:molybdopterin/thiamine biosynthesis adenylyltransferase|nr:MAG: thiamine biosynthesis protein ThiF [Colwellia sp.]
MTQQFDYDLAFSRNIGWFSESEQHILKTKRIAIAGMGGVGGSHLLTLIRLGITKFHLADFDEFACENTNRQAGANINTYDVKKLDTMVNMAKAINPEVDIKVFPDGIDANNTEEFLEGVDCYVDSLDFFALTARRVVFKHCAEKGIPATTAAPIGMGTAYLNFLPGKMTFEEYFGLEGFTENEQYLKFFIGLTPAALQKSYLVDPSKLDLANKKGPSTMMGCQLASGVAGSQVAKILLNRGDILNVPWGLHFDAYTNQFKKTWRPGGYKNPLQRLAFTLGKKMLLDNANMNNTKIADTKNLTIAEQVLDYARWAPSGDNAQCWRFELINDTSFVIHATDTRRDVVYDLDGHSSHLAHGILLETIDIAASKFNLKAHVESDTSNDECLKLSVTLEADNHITESSLLPYIKTRAVQRRAMGTRKLTLTEKTELEGALDPGFTLQWFESFDQKLAIAKLNFTNAKTRLTMKEAFSVHKEIIEWKSQFSETKIPEQALGVDWVTARVMQWMFHSWSRIEFANKYLAGTVMPRIQLDFIPSLKSCAHFALQTEKPITTTEEYIAAGRVLQRFWLTSARLGLGFQPEQTPVIFSKYLTNNIHFAADESVIKNAKKGKVMFEKIVKNAENTFFLGRVGRSELPKSRSIRLPLEKLLIK